MCVCACAHTHTCAHLWYTWRSEDNLRALVLSFWYMNPRDWTQVILDLLSFSTEPCHWAPFLSFTPVVSIVRQPSHFQKAQKRREVYSSHHTHLDISIILLLYPFLKNIPRSKMCGGEHRKSGSGVRTTIALSEDQSLILSSLIKRLKTACTSSFQGFQCLLMTTEGIAYVHAHTCTKANIIKTHKQFKKYFKKRFHNVII